MKIYRSKEGWVFGVCQGLADSSSIKVKYIRMALILSMLFFNFWPVLILYLAASLFMPVKRPEGYEGKGFQENLEDLKEDLFSILKEARTDFRNASRRWKKENHSKTDPETEETNGESISPKEA